jgi:nucleoside 2-deoxyribosyltransferase
MHIYCAGPIRGDRSYAKFFFQMIILVQELGHIPLTELIPGADGVKPSELDDTSIYRRDLNWLNRADALVAEVSAPSLGVGYEIGYALHVRKIPVLCLRHRSAENLSAMITGNQEDLLSVESYGSLEEMEERVKGFLEGLA